MAAAAGAAIAVAATAVALRGRGRQSPPLPSHCPRCRLHAVPPLPQSLADFREIRGHRRRRRRERLHPSTDRLPRPPRRHPLLDHDHRKVRHAFLTLFPLPSLTKMNSWSFRHYLFHSIVLGL